MGMKALLCSQCGAGMTGNAVDCTYCGTTHDRKNVSTGRGQKPDCPRCDQALASKTVSDIRIAHCKRCTGLWIPHDVMHELLALNKKNSKKLHALNRSDKSVMNYLRKARSASLQRDVAPAHCPSCQTTMRLESVMPNGSIYIDVCDDHGTWFDQAELRALQNRGARESLRRTAMGQSRAAGQHQSRSSDMDVISAAFLFEAVSHVAEDLFDIFD